MRLEIKHWLVLHALHHHPTVYAAADSLNISQSALSHRLAEAERRLGIALFERDGRRLKITPAGESLTQTALQIMPLLERAETDARDWAKDTQHLVRIGIASYNHFAWLGDFIHHLSETLPAVQLELVASANQRPTNSLLESQVDLVLAPGQFDHKGLSVTSLFTDELVLLTHPQHPLAQQHHIKAQDLEHETYLSYSRDSLPGFEYERFIRPAGVIPRLMKLVEMPDAIIELISANLGTSILSRWANQSVIDSGKVIAIPLGDKGLSLQWSCLTRGHEAPATAVKQVERLLKSWFKSKHSQNRILAQ